MRNLRRMGFLAAAFLLVAGFAAGAAGAADAAGDAGAAGAAGAGGGAAFAGAWSGFAVHDGDTTAIALEFEPADSARTRCMVRATLPSICLDRRELGVMPLDTAGDTLRVGPFEFVADAARSTLTGLLPRALVPLYDISVTLRRVDRLTLSARPAPAPARSAPAPMWTFEAGTPLWGGVTWAGGLVLAGGEDGRLFALDARTGRQRWMFRAGGAIRARATVAGDDVYLHADDGLVRALDRSSGRERWAVHAESAAVVRIPGGEPGSKYDRFGSGVVVAGDRLYVGTHDGRLLALGRATGRTQWEFRAGDAILAAPALVDGRLVFGSYDHFVYALDAARGTLLWKRDTRAAVVSTPALVADRVIVGTRGYDLLGLDAATGGPAWSHYLWFSWVESSPVARDGVIYVGSSDASRVFARDAHSGGLRWAAHVYGWAWGEPTVTADRVYIGTAGSAGTAGAQRGGAVALDRRNGRLLWRHEVAAPADSAAAAAAGGTDGCPGPAAVGGGRAYFAGLDGRVYAFPE
jgi:outer membrane protein assembly factor BamB